jgi:hypothetical protein
MARLHSSRGARGLLSRRALFSLFVLVVAGPLLAADPPKLTVKTETIEPPKELAASVLPLLGGRALVVAGPHGPLMSFWLRKEIPVTGKESASYRGIKPGMLVGAVQLHRDWKDFKTQEVPAGVYTLRYVLQPESKDHEGTAPQRDFVILVPATEDPKADVLPLKRIIEKSGKATGGTHPVVMLLYPFPKPAAEPVLVEKGKRVVLELRAQDELGFGFTVVGSSTDR